VESLSAANILSRQVSGSVAMSGKANWPGRLLLVCLAVDDLLAEELVVPDGLLPLDHVRRLGLGGDVDK